MSGKDRRHSAMTIVIACIGILCLEIFSGDRLRSSGIFILAIIIGMSFEKLRQDIKS